MLRSRSLVGALKGIAMVSGHEPQRVHGVGRCARREGKWRCLLGVLFKSPHYV